MGHGCLQVSYILAEGTRWLNLIIVQRVDSNTSLLYGIQVAPIFDSYYWSRDQTPASTEAYECERRMLLYFLQWPIRPSYWTATELGSKSQWGLLSPPGRNFLKWSSFIKNGLLLQLNIGCCSNRVELLVSDNWWIISECVRCSE